MQPHKFQVGRFVRVTTAKYLRTPPGRYEILRLMPPAQDNRNQYRVISVEGGVERMVKEEDIS